MRSSPRNSEKGNFVRRSGTALLAFASLWLLVDPAAFAAKSDDEATASARQFDENFAKACNAGDVAKLGSFYADDATVIFPGEAGIGRDRATVEAMLGRLCDPKAGVSVRLDTIQGHSLDPTHILVVGEWTIVAPGPDGKPVETKARASEILVESDAGWRYLLDHASDAPAPPAR